MSVATKDIKKLREETGFGVMAAKRALEEAGGDFKKAKEVLIEQGRAKAVKKADREASDGLVYSYIHAGGKAGSMVLVACETDFVAKTDEFKRLCHEIAMQVVSGDYENIEALLADEYIRDPEKNVEDLVTEAAAKLGENIKILKFVKFEV